MQCQESYNVINQTDVPYAQIPNDLIRDQSLSIEARGLLCLMLSHKSDKWQYMASNLMKVSGMGRTKYTRCMRELEQAGYILRKKTRQNGKYTGWNLYLSNKSGTYSESQVSRLSGKPTIGKRAPKNTKKLKKTNLKEKTVSHINAIENLNPDQSQNQSAGSKSKTQDDPYGVLSASQALNPEDCKNSFSENLNSLIRKMTVTNK